jgi:hypothetical protein
MGSEGMFYAIGHMQGKKYSKRLGRNDRRRKVMESQTPDQIQAEGCLWALAKGFIWLTFWGRLTLLVGATIISLVAS